MITTKDFNKKVVCIQAHNGFELGEVKKATEGMIFSAPEWWSLNTKKNLLEAFEKEYRDVLRIYRKEKNLGLLRVRLTQVIDKYMEMETDLFDSDDLDQIIDKVQGEDLNFKDLRYEQSTQTIRTSRENYWVASIKNNEVIFDSWDGAIKGRIDEDFVKNWFQQNVLLNAK